MSVESPVPDVRIFRLKPQSGPVPRYVPGQFFFIHFLDQSGASVIRRPYSVASAPSSPYLEFAIDMVGGQMTGRLAHVKAGDILGIEGPAGRMTFGGETKAAFVAGGTGVSPFISMLRHISEKNLPGEFVFFYSSRTLDHVLFLDELKAMGEKHSGIKAVVTLTREAPSGWSGECGRVGPEMLSKYVASPKEFNWFVCGPPGMVKAVRECLVAFSVDPKKLHLEGWG